MNYKIIQILLMFMNKFTRVYDEGEGEKTQIYSETLVDLVKSYNIIYIYIYIYKEYTYMWN
jgi:hypothetical protein